MITPPGEGGIAALRLAGRRSLTYLKRNFRPASPGHTKATPFLMRYGHFMSRKGDVIDEVLSVYMPKGKSYTGQDQVEIYCHGGRQVAALIQQELVDSGARVAEPGEFTKLAFLAGRIDLTKAEAVAEVIAANTNTSFAAARDHLLGTYHKHVDKLRAQLVDILAEVEASIDYPEEGLEPADEQRLLATADVILANSNDLRSTYDGGRIITEGYKIAICGRPNAGKSSLFNLLLRQQRALVTPTPGTTRDYLSEWIDLEGFKVNIIDTAGLRHGGGSIEKKGQKSSRSIIKSSDLVLWLADVTVKLWPAYLEQDVKEFGRTPSVLVGNKVDKIRKGSKIPQELARRGILPLSCTEKTGLTKLKREILNRIKDKMPDLTSGVVVTSARHRQKLTAASRHLRAARKKISQSESPELTAFDLRAAVAAIDEITGRIYSEEILEKIFSKFCVGK